MTKRKRGITKRKILFFIIFIVLAIYAISVLTPFYYLINNSLKTPLDFYEKNPWGLPEEYCFKNYVEFFAVFTKAAGKKSSFWTMFLNSAVFTASATVISLTVASVTAYVLSKFRFFGRDLLVAIAVGALVIPDLGSTSTVYKLFLDLGIMDTWFTMIRYTTPFGMGFLIIYGAFNSISNSYSEAAQIDGAGELRIFATIMLPMIKGTIGAITVVVAINCWNDYYTPYMYMNSIKMLSVGLQEISSMISQFNKPYLFAGMVVAITPLIIAFIIMKDKIIENTTMGGLKG